MGIIPVQFVIMTKILQVLHHIVSESTEVLVRQVFDVLEEEGKKSRIRETKNLLTDADSRTDTITFFHQDRHHDY